MPNLEPWIVDFGLPIANLVVHGPNPVVHHLTAWICNSLLSKLDFNTPKPHRWDENRWIWCSWKCLATEFRQELTKKYQLIEENWDWTKRVKCAFSEFEWEFGFDDKVWFLKA